MRERLEGHSHLDQLRVRCRCFRVAVIVLARFVGDAPFQAQVWRGSSFTIHVRRLLVIAHADEDAMT